MPDEMPIDDISFAKQVEKEAIVKLNELQTAYLRAAESADTIPMISLLVKRSLEAFKMAETLQRLG